MKATDLDLRELLAMRAEGGVLRFAGARVLLMDVVALGSLRRELVETLGRTGARGILTRFGFAHGWRTASQLRDGLPWDDTDAWRRSGGRVHSLMGAVRVEIPPLEPSAGPAPFAHADWLESWEAEQHVLHHGRADEPVCWTMTGFASGYMSFCSGRPIWFMETACGGCGDAHCRVVGRPREDWPEETRRELDVYYGSGGLERCVQAVTEELTRLEERLRSLPSAVGEVVQEAPGSSPSTGLVVASGAMHRVVDLASRVAAVDTTVLITGESGSGKERIAQLLHERSPRREGPFIAVNCGAIDDNLLESELFGHVRGAFTGAGTDRRGLFEAAIGGTIFLDEIGEVSPAMQVKLLRVLQEREIRRVGESKPRRVDVRVLAATHRDLSHEVAAGRFRQDLYYRLKVFELRVPPLRERGADIVELARVFLRRTSQRMRRPVPGLTPAAVEALQRHPWPGNVRELENALEYAVVVCTGERIDVADLPESVRSPSSSSPGAPSSLSMTLEEVERAHILSVLSSCEGNRERAAQRLGIGIATLYRKLRMYRSEGDGG